MRRGGWLGLVLLAAGLCLPRPASAFEFFDGRLQIHGFGESIVRVLNNNFEYDYDLSQMQFVLNLEMEFDIAPDGWGPFSALSAYTRIEVRYDCVWRHACSLAPNSVDHLGDRIISLPNWRTDGRESAFTGTAFSDPTADKWHFMGSGSHRSRKVLKVSDGLFRSAYENKGPDQILHTADDPAPLILGKFGDYRHAIRKVPGSNNGEGTDIQIPLRPEDKIETANGLFRFHPNSTSPLEADASCAASTAKPPSGCKFGFEVIRQFALNGYPNNPGIDTKNVSIGQIVFNPEELKPFRPFSPYTAEEAAKRNLPKTLASGLYYPSPGLRRFLANESQGKYDQNFSQWELEWNHGASQQDERELKEAYIDAELLDGRLWFRIGKQTIVWGKTEIFRSQDQWNPQDLGLATLPSLEESRIALWSIRAVWSFYDVGPLQDVRLELAANIDEFEPADLGRCGEPFAPRPVFGKCLGLFAHSAVGIGLAGEVRPDNPWDTAKGLEFGARLEWRWRRFSFALTDFYGFDDFPTPDLINQYSRNVDPMTGRPRFGSTELPCDPERGMSKGCLGFQGMDPFPAKEMANFNPLIPFTGTWGRGTFAKRSEVQNTRILKVKGRNQMNDMRRQILENHPANQTFFNFACAASVGFTDIIPDVVTECGFNIFGSNKVIVTGFGGAFEEVPVVAGLSMILGGSSLLYNQAIAFLSPAAAGLLTVVPLNHNDMGPGVCKTGVSCFGDYTLKSRTGEGMGNLWGDISFALPSTKPGNSINVLFSSLGSLSSAFTPEQQALLGCGAYYGTSCDRQGMDLLNAEASALFQSWPGFDGTPLFGYQMTDKGQPAPGTVNFKGGPVCTRYERGKTFILPGCRGPEDAGYRRDVDGWPYFNELLNHSTTVVPIAGVNTRLSNLLAFNNFAVQNGCPAILTNTGPTGRLKGDNIRLFNPMNCQAFRSEMAAFSFNFLAVAILFSTDSEGDGFVKKEDFDEFNPDDPYNPNRCSLAAPQFCSVVRSLLGVTGVGRNTIKAGGSWDFGRRDFTWHGGQELALRYDRRNILGFSTDFSEDWSKTNWGLEATWFSEVAFSDRNSPSGITDSDVFNLTISVDRPTFVNFLNANRTLLFNAQAFLSYVPSYSNGFSANGPFNALLTFTTITGYFQDRLFAVFTMVYDVNSQSGAGLPALTYRFSEAFSATFGMAFFYGRWQERDPFLAPAALATVRTGQNAYTDYVENGLAVVRDRDEFFFRIRYTF